MDEHLGLQTESIIGVDSRLRVGTTTTYPSRAIVYLYVVFPNTAAYSCTGWMIGPRTVATAGHCVYSAGDGGWATSIKAYPGRNGSTAPYGYRWGYRVFSPPGWTGSASQFYDYGAIQLAGTAIGNTTGWFGFRWQTSNSFPGYFTVRGYPGDKIGTLAATMWTMNGAVLAGGTPTTTYGKKLWYLMDTYGGQSGSPIYQTWGGQCCYGVGIHAYGAAAWPGPTPPYNSGTRITSAVFANLLNWRNWVYP
ncbi:MAG TPA: trypsin-like serine protease [bacterium]